MVTFNGKTLHGKLHFLCSDKYATGKGIEYLRDPKNQHIGHVISVHPLKIIQKMKVTGHIPDTLAKLVHGLMWE